MLHICMSVRQPLCDILINKHKQISGLLYSKLKLTYCNANTGCNWKGSFAGEEVQHHPEQQHCSVKFNYDNFCAADNPATYCLVFSTLAIYSAQSFTYVADRSICDQAGSKCSQVMYIRSCSVDTSYHDWINISRASDQAQFFLAAQQS